ncbi:uncharacterized protein LOC106151048 isoform X1 [Lingula anatina]|uniref:Uncharacterized protein LOC106151048 isoform X1 n=1 Tax=Lingula anatina TaxID=7574 RepID=A0A1S3H373_LINAN|nr:uncharacterized protein LOC106151048 isoform X1 [Lingula anatina]|eukprot:XP_013379579.1 uncharacterized protein LOC106151048 isoform X1 [Lingula anatina]
MAMLSRHTLDLLYVGSLQQFAGIGAIRSASKTLHGPNPGIDYRKPIPKVHRGPYKKILIKPVKPFKSDFHNRRGPQLMEKPKYPGDWQGFPKGSIADNRPIKVTLEAGKKYAWCTCGLSHTQPMCDGSHKKLDGSSFTKSHMKFRPIRFEVEETKDYWLCQCKQSDNRPYCDGTHRNEDIADKKKFATTEDVIENL